MRSKGSGVDTPANGVLGVPQNDADIRHEEDLGLSVKNLKAKVQQKEPGDRLEVEVISEKEVCQLDKSEIKNSMVDLSKKDLLKLLGIMEGEVQAREDVICMMKCRQTSAGALESRYGSAAPASALQALQRDSVVTGTKHHPSVYQNPMVELERLQEKHKDTYRRMLGQLLLAEKCHRHTVHELDTEKRKHADYMNKSDDFTNLLEQERERLKRLLETEKAYQVKKEKEHSKRLTKVREELVKLNSFALMLVNERQQNLEQMDQQTQRVQELSQQLLQREEALKEAKDRAREDGHRLHNLETELNEKSAKLSQQHEEMSTKLANHEANNRQLNAKIVGLTHKVEELELQNGTLKKSEEELMELRDKLSKGECGNSNLTTELENLRKRVMEMEGKEEEIAKTEHQCKELRKRLQEEDCRSKDLRLEVEKLQTRMIELEKLETAFSISKAECVQLHTALNKEKGLSKEHSDEVVALRIRLKELESSELKLEKSELSLKDDLSKLKSLTVALMDERKVLMEKIKCDDKQKDELIKIVEVEQGKVMEVTGKLIEESKKLLKFKSEMETKVQTLNSEKSDLSTKLVHEIDINTDLNSKISQMKKRIDGLEAEKLSVKNSVKGKMSDPLKQDNKVKELTFEIERLKNRLKQLEVVEGDLIKTEDQYDMLEKKFITEQDKANVLSQQVEEMRTKIAHNKAIEKGEEESQEEDLRQRCRNEEVKNRELQSDVVALKEKIHELMHKEDQLSQLQVDYSVLQQRFLEEEEKAKNMGTEVFHLSKELEIVKRHSRAMRPSLNGRRMMDVATTSTGVQTEALSAGAADEDTPAVFIRKSVLEENHIMSNLRQRCLRKPSEKSIERSPSSGNELKKSWIPWMRKKDSVTQDLDKHMNGDVLPSELTMTQKQGQPLHIRVTPDHQNNTATLEISNPTSEDAFSSSAPLSPNPSHSHPKSRITIIPTATPGHRKSGFGCHVPERAKSPVSITTISRAKSPESSKSSASSRPLSPVSIMTVSTVVSDGSPSPEPQEMTMGRAVFKVTPEKQMVPMAIRKCPNNNSSIITTEDNKIHIHLGHHPKMSVRQVASAAESKEMTLSTGTVLRSPRQITTTTTTTTTATRSAQSKVMSSITITPVSSATSRQTQNAASQDTPGPRTGLTRIPMSKSLKTGKAVLGSLGISSGVKMETQSMKIEVKKSVTSTTLEKGGRF
ncbi:filamin-A-interacting protein 1 [Eucyclogobius newberryi]|uniref:filamin-A-interacting protein 1 n=1 Tax=Eucyclogobius newberryi TaxID=166745 RepID=UPI003B5B1D3A